MEKLKEYWKTEIKELILHTINHILILSKEIEKSLIWVKKIEWFQAKLTINWKPFIFSELSNYFREQDFLYVNINYLNWLYKLILTFRVLWKKIESLSEDEQISILDFVNDILTFFEKQRIDEFRLSQTYKDIIFMELWLDSIDKIGDAKNETLALLEVIMLKR